RRRAPRRSARVPPRRGRRVHDRGRAGGAVLGGGGGAVPPRPPARRTGRGHGREVTPSGSNALARKTIAAASTSGAATPARIPATSPSPPTRAAPTMKPT